MIATNELRFVERTANITENGNNYVRVTRVLQQKWARNDFELMAESRRPKFEWRDVPCVKEQA